MDILSFLIGKKSGGSGATEPYVEETYNSEGNLVAAKMVGHETIRPSAFRAEPGMCAVSLPNGVTNIGQYAFGESYICYSELPDKTTSHTLMDNLYRTLEAIDQSQYPPAIVAAINQAMQMIENIPQNEWHYQLVFFVIAVRNAFAEVIPYLPTDVGDAVDAIIDYHESIAMRSLPDSVQDIDTGAFWDARYLELKSLPSSLKAIAAYAFSDCYQLSIAKIPENVVYIGEEAFSYCTNLTSITFEGTPSRIESTAFYECTNLTTINVPWAEGAVANAPWGATHATINYNYTGA